jgi:hypothetical protein
VRENSSRHRELWSYVDHPPPPTPPTPPPAAAEQVIEKQLKDALAKDQKATVAALEDKKRLLLSPAFISLKK